jgi:pyruvate dehydrogenase E2 component (dihydrolipoamide acetyltransferase)
VEIRLPKLGEGADSGTVVQVLVKEGDRVEKDEPIIELENEKAIASIPAPQGGTVERIHVSEGQEIAVGDLILSLSTGPEKKEEAPRKKEREAKKEPEHEEEEEEEEEEAPAKAEEEEAPAEAEEAAPAVAKPGVPPPAAPSVRKIAHDLGIDLRRVRGSERGGRIVMHDLRDYIEQLQKIAFKEKRAPAREVAPAMDFEQWGPVRRETMSGMRKAVSRKMTQSWISVPHVTQFDEADVTELLALKEKYDAAYEEKGSRLTLTSFVLKALVPVLRERPVFNASLDPDAGQIIYKDYIHIGVAVDSEHGLVVPVIRDVDKKSMFDLSKELELLGAKARDRKLSADAMRGGSFTVSNQGGIGGGHFTPIINVPEVAILGVGRGAKKPVVRDKTIEPRVALPLALGYDHRVIDGASAARFICALVKVLENFSEEDVKP